MIRLASVTKRYGVGGRPALHGVTAQIDAGEFVFLVGPSGSGKSTLLRLLIREERASEGLVEVAGRDVARIADRRVPLLRRTVGCVFQDFRLLPDRTVAGNVAFALDVVGRPRHVVRSVVPEVLELVGLTGKEKRFPDELSGGEQQRVAIARAFVGRPLILLADEPTGNLDPATSAEIMDLLDDINQAGTTVLMATHNAGLVDAMRRRVLELDAGILVRDEHRGGYDATPATSATAPASAAPASAAPASAATGLAGVPGASGVPAQRAPSAGDLVGRPAEPAGLLGPTGPVGLPGRPGEGAA
ncbi:cell division protein FtsE [Frankia sp. R43]|uniref:cell division ATP-binding protein FtsE n=1 Tax=Frankia sp. R43 TaxID=269536 RepID=UPI0006CA3F15|nr:cell division ATP-binding protein FtsE [Frankia sp. R43]KPM51481.1 cell division protein FtsE [Frankia sp. R43]